MSTQMSHRAHIVRKLDHVVQHSRYIRTSVGLSMTIYTKLHKCKLLYLLYILSSDSYISYIIINSWNMWLGKVHIAGHIFLENQYPSKVNTSGRNRKCDYIYIEHRKNFNTQLKFWDLNASHHILLLVLIVFTSPCNLIVDLRNKSINSRSLYTVP